MWGTVGVIYSADKAKAITGPLPTESLDLIFNKALAAKFEKCGINILDSWQDILPLMAKLDEIRPFVRRIASSGYYEQLADGESCLAIGYSGDAMIARRIRGRFAIERVYTPDELRTFNRAWQRFRTGQ